MARHAIASTQAPGPAGAASAGISAGAFVFVSAQAPLDGRGKLVGGSAADQAGRALDNLAHQLRSTGLSLDDVVSLEIHLVEPADEAAIDGAIEARFSPPFPSRTVLGVTWLPGGARLQIAAIAQRY
jgi:2-iminobutanoate/2-iminopropanoate deaminase